MAEGTRMESLKESVRKTAIQVQKINEFVARSQIFINSTQEFMDKSSCQFDEYQYRMETVHKNTEHAMAELGKESEQRFETLTELIMGQRAEKSSEQHPGVARAESQSRMEECAKRAKIILQEMQQNNASWNSTQQLEEQQDRIETLQKNSEQNDGQQCSCEDLGNSGQITSNLSILKAIMTQSNLGASLGRQKKNRQTLGKPPEGGKVSGPEIDDGVQGSLKSVDEIASANPNCEEQDRNILGKLPEECQNSSSQNSGNLTSLSQDTSDRNQIPEIEEQSSKYEKPELSSEKMNCHALAENNAYKVFDKMSSKEMEVNLHLGTVLCDGTTDKVMEAANSSHVQNDQPQEGSSKSSSRKGGFQTGISSFPKLEISELEGSESMNWTRNHVDYYILNRDVWLQRNLMQSSMMFQNELCVVGCVRVIEKEVFDPGGTQNWNFVALVDNLGFEKLELRSFLIIDSMSSKQPLVNASIMFEKEMCLHSILDDLPSFGSIDCNSSFTFDPGGYFREVVFGLPKGVAKGVCVQCVIQVFDMFEGFTCDKFSVEISWVSEPIPYDRGKVNALIKMADVFASSNSDTVDGEPHLMPFDRGKTRALHSLVVDDVGYMQLDEFRKLNFDVNAKDCECFKEGTGWKMMSGGSKLQELLRNKVSKFFVHIPRYFQIAYSCDSRTIASFSVFIFDPGGRMIWLCKFTAQSRIQQLLQNVTSLLIFERRNIKVQAMTPVYTILNLASSFINISMFEAITNGWS